MIAPFHSTGSSNAIAPINYPRFRQYPFVGAGNGTQLGGLTITEQQNPPLT
ncbi:MAG: hypothetical protein ACLFWI_11620 [Coleofasciculus sp.]|uniref:hypothetical protein n=1 Tax=Coleofasciculus sp. TaxID=3100458 RepID=UPI003A372F13